MVRPTDKAANIPQPLTFPPYTLTKYTCCTLNPEETVKWLVKYLGLKEISSPDTGLNSIGTRWVKLPSNQELHFNAPYGAGVELWKAQTDQMVDLDEGCTKWTPWMINHTAYTADNFTEIVKTLRKDKQPFFGPVLREDGVYQMYIRVPYAFYLEIDGRSYDEKVGGKPVTTWEIETKRAKGLTPEV